MPQPYPSDLHTYLMPYLPQPSPPTLAHLALSLVPSSLLGSPCAFSNQRALEGGGSFPCHLILTGGRGRKPGLFLLQGPWSPCLCSLKLDKWTVVHVYLGQWPIACGLELSVTQNCKEGHRGLPPTLLSWEFYAPWFRTITQQNINGKVKMTAYSSGHMKQEAQRGGKSLARFYSSLVTELGLEPMGLAMTSVPSLVSCQWERLCCWVSPNPSLLGPSELELSDFSGLCFLIYVPHATSFVLLRMSLSYLNSVFPLAKHPECSDMHSAFTRRCCSRTELRH